MIFNKYQAEILKGNINLLTDTIKVALLDNTYTPHQFHNYFSDVNSHEVSGTGYTVGGKALTGKSVTQDDIEIKGKFDANDTTWYNSTITARYAILYKDTGASSSSPLIEVIDFSEDKSTSSQDFTLKWNVDGIINTQ